MATNDDARQLRERVAALEAENARLHGELESAAPPTASGGTRGRRAGAWRTWASAICIVLAPVLIPVATVTGWARTELVSEDAFVGTFGPLAEDPAVQDLVIEATTAAIVETLDVDALTSDLFDGIASLDLPPAAQTAVLLLRAPAAAGVTSLIGSGVATAVESDAFPQLWRTALAASHRALTSAASGQSDGALTISADGELGIQLGPIIDAVRLQLVENGFTLAEAIPSIDRTIVLTQSDSLTTVTTAYALVVAVGWWLPFLALALIGAGIAFARRRRIAVLGVGVGGAIGGFLLAIVFAVGGTLAAASAPSLGIPAPAVEALYTGVVADMRDSAIILGVIGLVVALLAWVRGPGRGAVVVRRVGTDAAASTRRWLVARGLRTGRTGLFLVRYAPAIRFATAILAVLTLFALRPVTLGALVGVGVVALLVWAATVLLQAEAAASPTTRSVEA
ncbi:hypothetical protein AB0N73_11570 [Microbacterium sp. NPDC089189]|uniref:hypothetical protein n=1 Tax=Microbacterium sp. NPDC089189 TaxID=3154972 RepID=UPI0034339662